MGTWKESRYDVKGKRKASISKGLSGKGRQNLQVETTRRIQSGRNGMLTEKL